MNGPTGTLAARMRQVRRTQREHAVASAGTARELVIVAFAVPVVALAVLALVVAVTLVQFRERCPRCGSANVVDPRPMRIQRAEMYAVSELPASTRAKQYLASLVRTAEKARVPEHKRAAWALKKAPQWVRDALSEAPQEKQRVDAQSSNTSGLFDRREERT